MSSADIIEDVQGQKAAGDGDKDILKNQLGNDDGDDVDHLFPDKEKEEEEEEEEEEERASDDKHLRPSPEQEEEAIKKKYGGLVPKKKPLISKDHERAFFDSADWALGKQGAQKPKGQLEALRPKLQPTPHHQNRSRRSAYAHAEDYTGNDCASPEDANCMSDDGNDGNIAQKDQSSSGQSSM